MSSTSNISSREPSGSPQKSAPDPEDAYPLPLDRLGFLVAGIVHNLFGPLTAIIGTIDIMIMKFPDLENHLEKLARVANKLKEDVSFIMEKAGMDGASEAVLVDMVHLVNIELEFFKGDPRIKHEIEISFEPEENIPVFRALYRDFAIALDHLITNAIEAMNDITTKELSIALWQENGNLVLSIEDTGCGMDEETLSRAFDPFFTTKEPGGNPRYPMTRATGIGLTHANALLEPYGCTIHLISKPGEGTTVTVRIPFKTINEGYR